MPGPSSWEENLEGEDALERVIGCSALHDVDLAGGSFSFF